MEKHKPDEKVDLDDDPIVASYQVFLNPSLPAGRKLLLLQHPNRADHFKNPLPTPTEFRLKHASRMVELDIPLDHSDAYDQDKGLKWGRALKSSIAAKHGGSHGLAGGFGVGAVQQRGPNAKKRGELEDDDYMDWSEAVKQDKVLRTQTLGGQWPIHDEVQHMVGVFQDKTLHLTPAAHLVHLRPQFHHLDATTELDRQTATTAGKDGTAAGSGAAPIARAIHMTIKTTPDGETVTTETMADRLRSAQSEPWQRMRYVDDHDDAVWDVYSDLFLQPPTGSAAVAAAAESGQDAEDQVNNLSQHVPAFGTKWKDKELLEAVSGIKHPVAKVQERVNPVQQQPKPAVKQENEGRKSRARVRGGAATAQAPSRRAAKGKASASAAVQID